MQGGNLKLSSGLFRWVAFLAGKWEGRGRWRERRGGGIFRRLQATYRSPTPLGHVLQVPVVLGVCKWAEHPRTYHTRGFMVALQPPPPTRNRIATGPSSTPRNIRCCAGIRREDVTAFQRNRNRKAGVMLIREGAKHSRNKVAGSRVCTHCHALLLPPSRGCQS